MEKQTFPENISRYQLKQRRIKRILLYDGRSIDVGKIQKTREKMSTTYQLVPRSRKRVKREKENKRNSCPVRQTDLERKCIDIISCCYNENLKFPICYCDEMCPVFQDCCPDFNNSSGYDISRTQRNLILETECKLIKNTFQRWYRIVTKCPGTYLDHEISRKCQKEQNFYNVPYLQILPVTDRYHVTYKNIFCAICNEAHDVILWNLRFPYLVFQKNFNASSISEILNPINFENIFIHTTVFPPDGVYPRTCNGNIYGYINETGQMLQSDKQKLRCNRIQKRLKEVFHDNVCFTAAWEFHYCSTSQIYTSCISCHSMNLSTESKRWKSLPMYAIFTNVVEHGNCDQNPWRITTKTKDNICVRSTSSVSNPRYDFDTYFRVDGMSAIQTIDLLHTILFSYIKAISDVEVRLQFIKVFVYESVGCKIANMEMRLMFMMETDEPEYAKVSQWFEHFYWSLILKNENGVVNMFRIFKDEIQNDIICNFDKSKPLFKSIVTNIAIGEDFPRIQRFCQNVSFTLPEYKQGSPVEQLMNEVRVIEAECMFETMENHDSLDMILTTITYTIMGTGCMTLIGSIAIHVYLNTEVSIPSHITKHMMVSTLLFQILYIAGIGANDDKDVCFSLGVILHYLLLCVFSWKSICVGYLAHNLRQIRKFPAYAHLDKKKTRYIITCFGYTLPVLIVGPSVFIDKCRCTPFSIDYGNGICFPNPSSYPESIFVVTGPISIHIFFNITCLIISLYELSIATINVNLLGVSRSYTPIYLKLCVFSGIAWIFGIITLVMPNPIIRVLFILTCCSQGLFLSIITVCNVRVLRSLKTQIFSSITGSDETT